MKKAYLVKAKVVKKGYLIRRQDIFKTGFPLEDVHFIAIGGLWASVLFTDKQRKDYPFPITQLQD